MAIWRRTELVLTVAVLSPVLLAMGAIGGIAEMAGICWEYVRHEWREA